VIAFGCATTNGEEYRAYAGPTIERLAERDSLVMRCHGFDSIQEPYNRMLAEAAAEEDLEAVVLLHQDVAVDDDLFLARIRALLAASEEIAVIGSAGALGVGARLAWWEGSCRGGTESPVMVPDGNTETYSHGNFEVEAVDGMLLALSAWAARELRFDRGLGPLDGYDIDICLQARARGRRVVVGDFRVAHYARRDFLDHRRWVDAAVALQRKWALAPGEAVPVHP
jgi:GT2 family glycosyltransferase